MAYVESFSTTTLPGSRRFEYWNEVATATLAPMAVQARDRFSFSGDLRRVALSNMVLAKISSGAAVIRQSERPAALASKELFMIRLQLEGNSSFIQNHREAVLDPGDFTLSDASRPYEIRFDAPVSMLVLAVPSSILRRYIGCPEIVAAIEMRGSTEICALAANLMRETWSRVQRLPIATLELHISNAILHIIAAAYGTIPHAACGGNSVAMALRVRMLNFIDSHLADPQLGPVQIANACKISVRYVHRVYRLFETEPLTIGEHILRCRLEAAKRTLSDPLHRGRSITAIAGSVGFQTSAYFSRAFRIHYGMTPSECRHAADRTQTSAH